MTRHVRVLVVTALLAATAAGAPAAATGGPAGSGRPAACRDVSLVATSANRARIAAATLCLLNVQRHSHSLRKLSANRDLRQAAQRYSADMVTRRFFDHVSPDGGTLSGRVARTAYLRRASSWWLGEALGWNRPRQATPRATVALWMASAEHRIHLLQPRYSDVGIGISSGAPLPAGGPGVTYAAIFGGRTNDR